MSETSALRQRASRIIDRERSRYISDHPRSQKLADRANKHFPGGVPLHWMLDWGTPFPLFVRDAKGIQVTDADGKSYADFCLGDTGAMFGHSPDPVARALAEQVEHGMTVMLPADLLAEVGDLLAARFGLPFWQMTATASDANRAVVRWARALTGRKKVLVFDGCYHGQVEDAFIRLNKGQAETKPSLLGQVSDITETSAVAPFNDLDAVEALLRQGDIALILTEPALTNTAMVLPQPGFIDGLQSLAKRYGTLFCLDETHTISCGPGGYTRAHDMAPDFFVLGKPIAGGLPAAVYGFTADVEARMQSCLANKTPGYTGIGTTLSGNMLALAAMRACLTEVMTDEAYRHMFALADRLADGFEAAVAAAGLDWSVTRLGARAELIFRKEPLRTGAEAAASMDGDLEHAIHLYLLNRGFLVTPFHNMTLVSPATQAADVDGLVAATGDVLLQLAGKKEI